MKTVEKFQSLHNKLSEFEQFINQNDQLHIGKPNGVALRYPLPFDSCNVYVTDERFIAGVIYLAKRRIAEIKGELNQLADKIK